VRSRMKCELRFAGFELGPERRLESEFQTDRVAVENDGSIHVADEFDCVVELHVVLPFSGSVGILRMMRHQNQGAILTRAGLQFRLGLRRLAVRDPKLSALQRLRSVLVLTWVTERLSCRSAS